MQPSSATCQLSCFSLCKKLLSICSSLSSHVSCCLAVLSLAATKKLLTSNTSSAFGITVPNSLQRQAAQELAPASTEHISTIWGSASQPSSAADRHANSSHAAVRFLLVIPVWLPLWWFFSLGSFPITVNWPAVLQSWAGYGSTLTRL